MNKYLDYKMYRLIFPLLMILLVSASPSTLILSESATNAVAQMSVWYSMPPGVNAWNPFATANVPSNSYTSLYWAPLYAYWDLNNTWFPMLAQNFTYIDSNHSLIVTLWPNASWYNGTSASPLTAWDVWAQFMIYWKIYGDYVPWLGNITVLNNRQVMFTFNTSYHGGEFYTGVIYILTSGISTPYSIFGQFAKEVAPIVNTSSINRTALQNQIKSIVLKTDWVNGPFWIDPSTLTSTGATAYKNPHFVFAYRVKYDQLILHFAVTNDQMAAYLKSGGAIFAWHGLPVSTLASINQTSTAGERVIYVNNLELQGLWINIAQYPFNITQVRQALLYMINTTEFALSFPPQYTPYSGPQLGTEVPVNQLPIWIRANLYNYTYNVTKGMQLLEQAGFKYQNGQWYLPNGQPFTITLTTVSAWADWVAIAQNLQLQLKALGFQASLRAVDPTTFFSTVMPDHLYQVSLGWINYGAGAPSYPMAWNAFFNVYSWLNDFSWSHYNQSFPVPLPNGSAITVNPWNEFQNLESFPPYTQQYNISLAKLVWFWDYYVPSVGLAWVYRPYEINVQQNANWYALLGKPQTIVDGFPLYNSLSAEFAIANGIMGAGYALLFAYGIASPTPTISTTSTSTTSSTTSSSSSSTSTSTTSTITSSITSTSTSTVTSVSTSTASTTVTSTATQTSTVTVGGNNALLYAIIAIVIIVVIVAAVLLIRRR